MSRKIIISMHVSLDGFVAGPGGEMDWIYVDDELFDYAGRMTDDADTALYGRKTYEMMDAYWPTAAQQPNATPHDLQHSAWYNSVRKVVISNTMQGKKADKTEFIGEDIPGRIARLKQEPGANIQIFGSPSTGHLLMEHGLIDEYWLFVNPLILGEGIPMFKPGGKRIKLRLTGSTALRSGVVALHYQKES